MPKKVIEGLEPPVEEMVPVEVAPPVEETPAELPPEPIPPEEPETSTTPWSKHPELWSRCPHCCRPYQKTMGHICDANRPGINPALKYVLEL